MLRDGGKVFFQEEMPLDPMQRTMPAELDCVDVLEFNLIVRPCSRRAVYPVTRPGTAAVEHVKPAAFLGPCRRTRQKGDAGMAVQRAGELNNFIRSC